MCYVVLYTVSSAYPTVTGKLLTRYAPFRRSPPEYCYPALPLDLHVLSLPLAFILSQDQTLLCIFLFPSSLFEIDALDLLLFGTCFLYFLSVFSMNSLLVYFCRLLRRPSSLKRSQPQGCSRPHSSVSLHPIKNKSRIIFPGFPVKNPAVLSSGTAKIRTFSKSPNFFSRFFNKNRYRKSVHDKLPQERIYLV